MTTTPPSINQRIFARIRSVARTRSICADYARYEARKAEWLVRNPGASCKAYDAAMVRIARECGV